MASFASSATTGGARKHAWTNKLIKEDRDIYTNIPSMSPHTITTVLYIWQGDRDDSMSYYCNVIGHSV